MKVYQKGEQKVHALNGVSLSIEESEYSYNGYDDKDGLIYMKSSSHNADSSLLKP